MTRRPTLTIPERPPGLTGVPVHRFWGEKKPPKNRSEMFSVRTAPPLAAGEGEDEDAASSVATLRLYGPIDSWGGWWGISAKEVGEALDALGAEVTEIRVRINSPGGEAWEGLAILNMLRAHKAKAVAVVDGIAASAASVIATGCNETVMSPGTQMMIHDASTFAWGDAAEMRKSAEFLDSVSDSIASVYAESGGGTDAAWRALMVEETWYTAKEAVASGLADRVGVVPDAGPTQTAGDVDELDDDLEDAFDLSIFSYAGRSHAPAPAATAAPPIPPTASADGSTRKEGARLVDFTDEQIATLREQVGFPDNADAETITAAVVEALTENADPTPSNSNGRPSVPEGMTLIESDVLTQLQASATSGAQAREQQLREERDRAIDNAIASGRTTPARREHWQNAWDADPDGTRTILEALPEGLVPVDAIGHAEDSDKPENADTVRESDAYKNWSM